MGINTLINLLDEHNEANLIATDKFMPHNVIYVFDKHQFKIYRRIEAYYKRVFPKINVRYFLMNNYSARSAEILLNKVNADDTIINITGGKRIDSLIILNMAKSLNFRVIYIDALKKKLYEFDGLVTISKIKFRDMFLEDIFKTTGIKIINDSSYLLNNHDIVRISNIIHNNLELWDKYKIKLYNNEIFEHTSSECNKVVVHMDNIDEDEKNLISNSIRYLYEKKIIRYKNKNNLIEVDFIKEHIRSFIFKSGTWLEIFTANIIREIYQIDEVKCGVTFVWNNEKIRVTNELDVIAVYDTNVICISCKDSEKYDEDALNELDVYSKRIGGDNVKKILVSTKMPAKRCVIKRAEAMNIHIIILGKNIKEFKNKIKKYCNIKY
ncbi:DUF1887 family CARF protein [Clostridium sp. BJN0001]|uniref:Card1-like endonuclease domain-containing protein n=1 Tax=Clostridium sp. BJN0001 TaxID=2930219 RepID=UPI001FD0961C|nr:DUF1887 family CARF protein [Clostridium sp. BJN0001]